MTYVYQADVWCDACGDKIKAQIGLETPDVVPEDTDDERSYDSADYPKHYDPKTEESDGPQNCADGSCGGMYLESVPGDRKYLGVGRYGTFLENGLTTDGYRSLKSMLDEHGEHLPSHAREWANYYQFEYHDNEFAHASDWLNGEIDRLAAGVTGDTSARLVEMARELARELDGDQIQNLYQSDMDADGFFKESGWYSPEFDDSETEER